MAGEKPTPPPIPGSTPPPIPRSKQRERHVTQEIQPEDMQELTGVIEQARTLLQQLIEQKQGESIQLNPDLLKLSVRGQLSRLRGENEPIDAKTNKDLEEMMDLELRKAGIQI